MKRAFWLSLVLFFLTSICVSKLFFSLLLDRLNLFWRERTPTAKLRFRSKASGRWPLVSTAIKWTLKAEVFLNHTLLIMYPGISTLEVVLIRAHSLLLWPINQLPEACLHWARAAKGMEPLSAVWMSSFIPHSPLLRHPGGQGGCEGRIVEGGRWGVGVCPMWYFAVDLDTATALRV